MSKFLSIFILTVSSFSVVVSFDAWRNWQSLKSPGNLTFTGGDIVACLIHSKVISTVYGAEHHVFALNSTTVAQVSGDGKDDADGTLSADNFVEWAKRDNYKVCRIATAQHNRVMFDLGVSPLPDSVAISNALRDIGKTVYYDLYGCNCQHWVTSWKYGKAWSIQSNYPPNAKCQLPNDFINKPKAYAETYVGMGQKSAVVEAHAGERTVGKNIASYTLKGPNVGAHAAVGKHHTGFGFNAGVGEVSGNLGNVVGGTLGLNVNTGFGIGKERLDAKVLGTGFSLSKSKGASFCLLGSCVRFG